MGFPDNGSFLTTKVRIKPEFKEAFVNWQAKLHASISAFPHFLSLEIAKSEKDSSTWLIIQRFQNTESASLWQTSEMRKHLLEEIQDFLSDRMEDQTSSEEGFSSGVIEVFVTQVDEKNEQAYAEWVAKIHQAEAAFPGFQRMYVQAPKKGTGKNWMTFLQFDNQENLDRWLSSTEREALLNEGKDLIAGLESHRVISPFAGWFPMKGQENPALWKQTMLVLLVLFPIVMLEMKFLPSITGGFN